MQKNSTRLSARTAMKSISRTRSQSDASDSIQPESENHDHHTPEDVTSTMIERAHHIFDRQNDATKSDTLEQAAHGQIGHNSNLNNEMHALVEALQNILVSPSQRLNETRFNEILDIVENSNREQDDKVEALQQRLANLLTKLYDKLSNEVEALDNKIDGLASEVAASKAEVLEQADERISKLEKTTKVELSALSATIDLRIAALAERNNGQMRHNMSRLSQAIAAIGEVKWEDEPQE